MDNESLANQRKIASEQSLGLSDDVIYKSVRHLLKTYHQMDGKLLDFGAGKGAFLKSLSSDFKYEMHAIDLMRSEVDSVTWHVHDLNQPFPLADFDFDVVTAIEVIEHLENPRGMIRDLWSSLKPGGRVVVTTPNNESYRALLSYTLRGHFVAFTDSSYPAHITALNRLDLKRILQETGFKNIEFSYTNQGQVPKASGLTWQGVSFGQLKGLRFSDNVLVTALKPS